MASSSECERREAGQSSSGAAARGASASRSEARKPDQRFPRALRLTQRRQFQAVYQNGLRASASCFTIFGLPNGLEHSRIGLTVTRKTGNAVVRNRIKRRMREVFRRNRERIAAPMDLVVNGRRALLEARYEELVRDFLGCCATLARRAAR